MLVSLNAAGATGVAGVVVETTGAGAVLPPVFAAIVLVAASTAL